jgi:hypothetical protein
MVRARNLKEEGQPAIEAELNRLNELEVEISSLR